MLVQVCQEVEQRALAEKGKTVKRQRLEWRYLLTPFGWIRLGRWRVKQADGHTECPLDDLLGLKDRERVTPWVKERATIL